MNLLRLSLLAVIATFMVTAASSAEENTPSEAAREIMAPVPGERSGKPWKLAIDGSWFPRSDTDGGGSAGMSEAKLEAGRTFRISSSLSFTPEITYSLLHISAPAGVRLPEKLHSITAGLRSDYRTGRDLSLTFLLAPGLAGDFTGISRDDLRLRFGATVRYSVSKRWMLIGGAVYQHGYKSRRGLPIVGAIFRPDERWTITVAAPRPGVSYAPNKALRLNLGAEMSGGEYQLHEKSMGARVLRYRDIRVVGGADFRVAEKVRGELAAGYAFARKFSFYDIFDPTRKNVDVDDGPFARAGLRVEW